MRGSPQSSNPDWLLLHKASYSSRARHQPIRHSLHHAGTDGIGPVRDRWWRCDRSGSADSGNDSCAAPSRDGADSCTDRQPKQAPAAARFPRRALVACFIAPTRRSLFVLRFTRPRERRSSRPASAGASGEAGAIVATAPGCASPDVTNEPDHSERARAGPKNLGHAGTKISRSS